MQPTKNSFTAPAYFKKPTEVKDYQPANSSTAYIASLEETTETESLSGEDNRSSSAASDDDADRSAVDLHKQPPTSGKKRKEAPAKRNDDEQAEAVGYDNQDWMFDRGKFHTLNRQYGPFTLDAACSVTGDNAQCKEFCSKENSFLDKQLRGHVVWVNAPYDQAAEFLGHYTEQKKKYPGIAAMFVLPQWESQPWWAFTKGFSRVRRYPKGTQLFTSPGPKGSATRMRRGATNWPVMVFWDPPALDQQNATLPEEKDDRLEDCSLREENVNAATRSEATTETGPNGGAKPALQTRGKLRRRLLVVEGTCNGHAAMSTHRWRGIS